VALARPRWSAWLGTWALAIVVLLVVAGIAAWAIEATPAPASTAPPTGWTTFRASAPIAQAIVNRSIVGPWALSFAAGLAANGPWAPTLRGTFGATPSCAAKLGGISLFTHWNDSYYPRSNATTIFSSGTAPLWTFGYVDPAGDTEIVSVVNGTGVINGIWTVSTGCAQPPSASYRVGFSPSSMADSSQVAATVDGLPAGAIAPPAPYAPFDPSHPGTAFELYSIGNWLSGATGSAFDLGADLGAHLPAWWAAWGQCGLPGVSGWGPLVVLRMNATSASNEPAEEFATSSLCSSVAATGSFGRPTTGALTGASGNFESWGLTVTPVTSGVPAPAGWNVVTTNSIVPALWQNLSTGPAFSGAVPSGAATCGVGTPNLTACAANPAGWYAVLVDAHGNWLDSYPSVSGGANWTRSGVTVTTGDAIEIIVPAEAASVKLFELSDTPIEWFLGESYLDL